MFEDIFQKAFNLDPEPFQELLVKAKDELGDLDEGSLQMPSFTPSTKAPKVPRVKKQKVTTAATQTVAAPTAPTKPKLSAAEFKQKFGSTGIAMPQGAPSQAGVKTNVQIDSGTVPQQAIVNSPTGGLQNKTVHTRPKNIKPAGNGPGLYVSPGQPVQQELALEAAKQNKTPLEHTAHPDGGNVVTGNKIGEQPVQPVFDHKARWYHDNLQVGDRVGSKGWSEEHQRWVPFESEVTELNPNGQKFIHVKPIHKDLRDDPNAPSMPVHYGGVDYFHRKDSTNPHKLERYQYAGEYQNPDATAPPNTNPAKQYSPEEANQHLTHLNELKKVKADSVKKHLSDGDYVEFWMRDPKTNEPVLTRGHAYALPTMQTGVEGGEDGAGAKEKASTNKVTVQTEDGPVAVNLWDIHRFGKEVVGDLHLFGFDKTTGAWKNQGVQQNAQQDEPTSSPAEPPNTYPSQTAQQPFIPQVVGTAEHAHGEEEQEPIVPNLPHTPETSRSQTVMAAGAKFLHEDPDEGVIRFSDPKKPGSMYELPIGEVNEENVKAAMGQTPPAVPSGSFHEEEPELNLKSHWTHTMDPALASSATKMVDQLDKLRQTSMVPFNVLQARHTLLHTNDEVKAARSIRDISKFLSNPSVGVTSAKPKTSEDYQNSFFTTDLNSVGPEDVQAKLGTNRPAVGMLADKQAKYQQQLVDVAKAAGNEELATKIGSLDPTKDNREAFKFYENLVRTSTGGKVPLGVKSLPSNEHIQMQNHLNELSTMMEKEGLDIPAYQNKLAKLNYMVENDPDSPVTHRMFNELHNYVYDQGENDPYHQLHQMREQIGKLNPKKVPQQIIDRINNRMDNVEAGALDPTDVMNKNNEDLTEYGVTLKPPALAEKNRSQEARDSLNRMVEHSKVQQDADAQKAKEVEQKQQEQTAQQQGAPPTQQQGAGLPGDQMQQQIKKTQKELQHIIENLKKNEEVLNDFDKVDQKTWKPTDHQVYQAYSQHISDDLAAYKKQADILRQAGVDVPDYEPTHASAASKANDEAKQRHAATLTARESYGRLFIRNAARREDERIDALRHHFLSRSRTQPVEIQQDLANIDQYIKQSIETSKWEPVPATIAKTAVGQAFLNKVNESISYVKERALLAGVPVAEALAHQELTAKSLSSILASEKTLVRRDISLALKKAFYNSVDSGDLKKATNLMASYFDDFIDTIMGTYTNIPIDLRKLFTRKMLKSLIDEVIKDNKYSAVSMRDDFTAPLDTDVIKSMGGEIAAVVTKFKMQANPDSDFLVIDLSKSISGGNPREVEAVQERSRLLKGQTGTPIEWFHWLKGLEDDMYKSGCVTTHISDNRIRKFIADNDQSVLLDFYNSSVNDLNNRCKEIKEWQE